MDDIARKLALIDEQLAGRNIHKRIISTSPVLFAAVGLIAGILLQSAFDLQISIWLTLLALLTTTAILFFIIQYCSNHHSQLTNRQSPVTNHQYALAYLSLICFVCLGAIRLTSYYRPKPNDIRNFVPDEPSMATIRGIIITEPYTNTNRNWKFARFKPTDPTSSFYLQLTEVEAVTGWAKAAGTVRVQVDEPVLDLKAGDYIQAYCWLDKFRPPTNPGQFNIAEYLALKNVFIAASVKSRQGIEILQAAKNNRWPDYFTKIKSRIRKTANQALVGDLSIDEQSRGLLEALLLGYRRNIDSETYKAFRKTGLLHFISLSGMHFGILIGIVWWLSRIVGLLKRGRAIVCIIAIAVFLLVVPPRAPTVRAAIIGWVFCASYLFRRHSNSTNTLSLAAIILLLIRPTNLFEAGWQLSFATVLGLVLFCERIHFFLYEKICPLTWGRIVPKTKPFYRIIARPGPYLLRLLSTGITAWLGGAGILLYHFHTINPLTSVWTVLVFPLVSAILTFGFLKIVLFFLLPTAGSTLSVVVALLSDSLIWVVKLLAHIDISHTLIGHVPLAPVILYYCLVLFVAFVHLRRPLIKKLLCAAALLAIIIFLGAAKWQRTHSNQLVVTCLDVSHGQAVFVRLPGKANILFDAGSLHRSDIGRKIVVPFLNYSGINKIDAIIISHNDIDHINGIPEIAEYCTVGGIYANAPFLDKADQWGTAKFLSDSLNEHGLEIKPLIQELNLNSSAEIKILWPGKQLSQYDQLNDNDKSLVSLLEFAGTKILLCSDIERFAQKELLRLYPNLTANIVVVPHHGSTTTSEPDFLEKLDADILIYSCDRMQYQRLRAARQNDEAKSFYTPKDGAITVCIRKDGTITTSTFTP